MSYGIDYTGNIDLKNSKRYQFLLASQNYGTFYSIYAKFHCESNILKKIEFEIINYKGTFNIGFINDNKHGNSIFVYKKDGLLTIKIPVKIMTGNNETSIEETSFFNKTPIDISDIEEVYTKKGIISYAGEKEDADNANEIFDSEFHYRDGKNVLHPKISIVNSKAVENKYLPGSFQDLSSWNEKLENQEDDGFLSPKDITPVASGRDCMTSLLKNIN